MTTHYASSKGPVEIATMALSYAKNARNKLQRSEPERTAEIEAIGAHVERLEAEATAKALAGPEEGPVAAIGDNGGPPLEPAAWEAIKINLDDLLTEAANWADGIAIGNQSQADAVSILRRSLQDAIGAADIARVAEKKPLDEAIAEIQDRYNAYIAPLKNKAPGKASKAAEALGNLLTAWLNKCEAEQKARAAEAAAKAAEAAAEAIAARTEAKGSTDLAAMDLAEDKLAQAETLLREAKGIATEKVTSGGGAGWRATGLRSVWSATITDSRAALLHYIAQQRGVFDALVQELADKDARNEATRRATPGVVFTENKKAA